MIPGVQHFDLRLPYRFMPKGMTAPLVQMHFHVTGTFREYSDGHLVIAVKTPIAGVATMNVTEVRTFCKTLFNGSVRTEEFWRTAAYLALRDIIASQPEVAR